MLSVLFVYLSDGEKCLPCVKGGGTACRDGGIVKSNSYTKTIPQPAFLLRYAPWQVCYANIAAVSSLYTREPFFMFTYDVSIFLTSTAFVDTKKYGISLSRYTVFLKTVL